MILARRLQTKAVPAGNEPAANRHGPTIAYHGRLPRMIRVMFATSIPSSVAEAEANDLKPSIGLIRLLMVRWSCSTMLFRYLIRTISIGIGQPKRFNMRFFSMDVDDYARVALLRTYEKEPRLLATIDQIAQQMRKRTWLSAFASRI
jgi:hypothetical protein